MNNIIPFNSHQQEIHNESSTIFKGETNEKSRKIFYYFPSAKDTRRALFATYYQT